MRIATWNVNSLKVRLPRVEEWLADVQPDVLCMQETKLADDAFPALTFAALGYESRAPRPGPVERRGDPVQGRARATSSPNFADGGEPDPDARIITARCGGVASPASTCPTAAASTTTHYQYKLRVAGPAAAPRRRRGPRRTSPSIVAGDFNIAPDDRDVYDPTQVRRRHAHQPGRARSCSPSCATWGLVDLFRAQHDEDRMYSWWDYRAGDFHQGRGLRIDLVLGSAPGGRPAGVVRSIDRNARKGQSPSDHAPVDRRPRGCGDDRDPMQAFESNIDPDDARIRLADATRRIIDELASSTADAGGVRRGPRPRRAGGRRARRAAATAGPTRARRGVDRRLPATLALRRLQPVPRRAQPARPADPDVLEHRAGSTEVCGTVTYPGAYEGPPGCVHGGFIAAGFDEVLGFTQAHANRPGMTASLTIDYRSPTPLHRELHFRGRIDRVEGRKTFTSAELVVADDGRLCAQATGLFIAVGQEVFERMKDERTAG